MIKSKPDALPSCCVSKHSLIAIVAYTVEVTLPAAPPAVSSGETIILRLPLSIINDDALSLYTPPIAPEGALALFVLNAAHRDICSLLTSIIKKFSRLIVYSRKRRHLQRASEAFCCKPMPLRGPAFPSNAHSNLWSQSLSLQSKIPKFAPLLSLLDLLSLRPTRENQTFSKPRKNFHFFLITGNVFS